MKNIFRRPDYKSDATQFLEQLKKAKPELEAQQMTGLKLLWDKKIDRDASEGYHTAEVAQKPYVYQTNPK